MEGPEELDQLLADGNGAAQKGTPETPRTQAPTAAPQAPRTASLRHITAQGFRGIVGPQAASKDREVVVFTHDDRLPEAVRRLDIDAFALAKTDDLPPDIARRVIGAGERGSDLSSALEVEWPSRCWRWIGSRRPSIGSLSTLRE